MLKFNVVRDHRGGIQSIETGLSGYDLLSHPQLNKGCAFNSEERQLFDLESLLPHRIETLDEQLARMYLQYQEHHSALSKNVYLNVLHDYNETLFYKLASQHLEEMLPILYTPTVGEAVEHFSLELRKPHGLYLSYPDRDQMDKILENNVPNDTRLIVVTDGEAVLGLGDQGIGGIKISNAKLMVYTLCAGIDPHHMVPMQLDVGTNNQALLEDPMYLGWRHERIAGAEYDDFIDQFVQSLQKKFPHVYLHWEDFGRDHARQILTRYRNEICTFNGDMQGTGTVTLASVLAGCVATDSKLTDQRIVIFGAGTAGVGIADQLCDAMQRQGCQDRPQHHFWLIDKQGLLVDDQSLPDFQKPYARPRQELANWSLAGREFAGLIDVIREVKPTILIGCSAVGGAFTEAVVKTMAAQVERPIIMPLSNPTVKSEATPDDLLTWTQGKVIIATGSPFSEVDYEGEKIRISQSNNALAYPAIGLGAIAVKAKRVSDDMLWVAAESLSQCSPASQDARSPLLPKLSDATTISRKIALAVAEEARQEGLAQIPAEVDLYHAIQQVSWEPRYYRYVKKE